VKTLRAYERVEGIAPVPTHAVRPGPTPGGSVTCGQASTAALSGLRPGGLLLSLRFLWNHVEGRAIDVGDCVNEKEKTLGLTVFTGKISERGSAELWELLKGTNQRLSRGMGAGLEPGGKKPTPFTFQPNR